MSTKSSNTNYPVALKDCEGNMEFTIYLHDPGPSVQMCWIVNPFDHNCDQRGRCTYTRQDEVVENDGVAHTVYEDLS